MFFFKAAFWVRARGWILRAGALSALVASPCMADSERYVEVTPRDHDFGETALYLGALYVLGGLGYFITSYEKIQLNASFENYKNNLGRFVIFDNDALTANWVVHVYTGSQAYLFYRARSYTKTSAFLLTFLQSALYEMTLEIIQEPASIEDLLNTPIVGSILGRGFELASIELLNSAFFPQRLLGHLINPMTIFGWYEGVVTVYPLIGEKSAGLGMQIKF